jgi:hypothetical protein
VNPTQRRNLVPSLAALGAAIICLASLRDGIGLSSDGWVYWQGSVSLIRGLGYRLFYRSQPITSWPPLFSISLAIFQAAFGVTGRTLVMATVMTAALAAFLWMRLTVALAENAAGTSPAPSGLRLTLVAVFVTAFIGPRFRLLLADDLALALLAGALLSAMRLDKVPAGRRFALHLIELWLWLFLFLACKNSALAWLAGVAALVVALRWTASPVRALVIGVGTFIVPFVGWLALRAGFGQLDSHPPSLGPSVYSPWEYGRQALTSLGGMIGPRRFLALGPILALALFAAVLITAVSQMRERPEFSRLLASLLLFVVTALASTGVLLSLAGLPDELSDRFVWFAALLLVSLAGAAWTSRFPRRVIDGAMGALLIIVLSFAVFYAGRSFKPVPKTPERQEGSFVRPNWTIEPGFVGRPPERRGALLLVSPPVPDWERK